MTSDPNVTVAWADPRGIAAVHARVAAARVSAVFGAYLDRVYAAGRAGEVALDGRNVFLDRDAPDAPGELDVAFGVCVASPFEPMGAVVYTPLPEGRIATATHRGDYARLGETHAAVIAGCRALGHALAGPRWEVYGHFRPDEVPTVEVSYLLDDDGGPAR